LLEEGIRAYYTMDKCQEKKIGSVCYSLSSKTQSVEFGVGSTQTCYEIQG